MPSKADLALYQGDDYAAVVTVDGIDDLAGFTPKAQIRLGPADLFSGIVVEMSAALAGPTTINLVVPHDITAQLSGMYFWDLQITDPVGIVTTLLAGKVVVTREVTRGAVGLFRMAA